jgi:hypothetical protein
MPTQKPCIDWGVPLPHAMSLEWDPALELLRHPSGWDRGTFDLYWVDVMFRRYFRQRPTHLGEWRTTDRWAAAVKFMTRPGDPHIPEHLDFKVRMFLNRAPNKIGSVNPWRVEARTVSRSGRFGYEEYTLLRIPEPIHWCEAAKAAWREAEAESQAAWARDPGVDGFGDPLPEKAPYIADLSPFSSETFSPSELVWLWADSHATAPREYASTEESAHDEQAKGEYSDIDTEKLKPLFVEFIPGRGHKDHSQPPPSTLEVPAHG